MEYWIKQHTCGFPYISLNYMGLKYYVDRGSGGTCGTFRSVPEAVAACGQAPLPRGSPYDRQFTYVTAQGGECKGGRVLDRAAVVWGSGHLIGLHGLKVLSRARREGADRDRKSRPKGGLQARPPAPHQPVWMLSPSMRTV